MSSPPAQILRSLAQLQRLPVHTKIELLTEALPHASPAEAMHLGLALVECAADYSEIPPSGSRFSRAIQQLFATIARRARPDPNEALAAIVRVWTFLPPEARAIASVAGRGRWSGVVGVLATHSAAATRLCVAELARGAGDSTLASIACELLGDQDERVAVAAERAICFLALVASDPSLAAWSDHASIAEYEEAARVRAQWGIADFERVRTDLAAAVRSMATHRREAVLWGALLLLDPSVVRGSGQLARWVNDREQSSHSFLRGLLRRDASPLSRLRAWQWLGTTAVSGASADRVLAARTLDEHEAVLSSWHLMLNPARLAKLRLAERAAKPAVRAGFFPSPEIGERLSADGRLGGAKLALGLGVATPVRDGVCETLLSDTEAFVRFGASGACSSRMLTDFCFDSDAAIARSSVLRLSVAAVPDAAVAPGSERAEAERSRLSVLLRSPNTEVRRLAETDLQALCVASEINAASRVAFRKALAIDRSWVIERLRGMLGENEDSRSFAVQMARKLGIVIELRDPVLAEIRRLLREPAQPARTLATAVAALRDLPGDEPLRLLRESSSASDHRVRANAIDTLVTRAREGTDSNPSELTPLLLELKDDEAHRVRGSAVRGLDLLGVRTGQSALGPIVGEQLLKMLEDPRPLHRLAGAWVADRTLPGNGNAGGMGGQSLRELKLWPAMASRLRVLAINDQESRVRVRCRLALVRAGEAPVRGDGVLTSMEGAA